MLLPTQLHEKHHVLFTFHHISCEQPKSTKRREGPVANVVGYAWLPLLNKGRYVYSIHTLCCLVVSFSSKDVQLKCFDFIKFHARLMYIDNPYDYNKF